MSAITPEPMAQAGPVAFEHGCRFRLMLVALSAGLWGLIIAGRLVQLQFLEHQSYKIKAARQSERTLNLAPQRGPILDRHGRPLSVSVEAESIYADPQEVDSPPATAQLLARALGLSVTERREVLAQLRRDKAFVWIKRKVDPNQAQAVRALELPGVGFLAETRRYYPKRELAAQVLGYVSTDNKGIWGLEYGLDQYLRGRAAKVVIQTDARRRPVSHQEKPSTEGHTVVLTLDEVVQHIAEAELARAMQATSAASGTILVLDPTTGEILAAANRPTFNPNRFWVSDANAWRDRVVADAFEPGSIFKIITAAAGLQERVVAPDEVIDCGHGAIEVGGLQINDHAVFDRLTFREVMAKSSDVGVIRVAQRVGGESFQRYLHDFGFGSVTGVDLPGESAGLLRPRARWSVRSLASMAFGQEVGVTALQMALAVGAVAADGYLMRPLIVRQIEDSQGGVVKAYRPVAVRRVLTPETVDTLREILKGVVRNGTGRLAAVPGYDVAGKTGTAQIIDPATGAYSASNHVASFVGFVPAARPALVILVSLDSPRGARNQGGDVAAPVFARVAEATLRYLAVAPDDPLRVLRVLRDDSEPPLTPAALQIPISAVRPADREPGVMPDLRGRSAREAALAAARFGLTVELRGSGQVVLQTPAAGAEIEPGMTCRLTLGPIAVQHPPATASGVGS